MEMDGAEAKAISPNTSLRGQWLLKAFRSLQRACWSTLPTELPCTSTATPHGSADKAPSQATTSSKGRRSMQGKMTHSGIHRRFLPATRTQLRWTPRANPFEPRCSSRFWNKGNTRQLRYQAPRGMSASSTSARTSRAYAGFASPTAFAKGRRLRSGMRKSWTKRAC